MNPIVTSGYGAHRSGYSLLEVLIAGSLVAIGIAAAALLANSAVQQHEFAAIGSRAANMQEQVVRLYRLGYSPLQITSILPTTFVSTADEATNGSYFLDLAESPTSLTTNGIRVEVWLCRIVYQAASTTIGTPVYRTNTVTSVREQNR